MALVEFYCKLPLGFTFKQQDAFCLKESTLHFSPSLSSALWNSFKKIKRGEMNIQSAFRDWN